MATNFRIGPKNSMMSSTALSLVTPAFNTLDLWK